MKTAKLGAMFLISILALAGIGMGYAAWTDTITIDGTVNTGNVDLVVDSYSHTYVYKVPNMPEAYPDEIAIRHITGVGPGFNPIYPMGWIPVAHAKADQAYDADGAPIDDAIHFEFENLFPCIDFVADVVFHYVGSIPVKINYADFDNIFGDDEYPDWLLDLWNIGAISVIAYRCDETGYFDPQNPEIVDVGTQLHYCDYVILIIKIHIPQEWPGGTPTDDLMLRSGGFTAHIDVIQWNEYEP